MIRFLTALVLAVMVTTSAQAIFTEERLKDPAQEARAQELMKELRCLVCQNQAISESHASLARDLRELLRERIAAGDTDQEALDFMVARYGDWVLLDPPIKVKTYILWFGPLLILIPGLFISAAYLRRRRAAGRAGGGSEAPLSDAERAELDRVLSDQR